MIKEKKRISWAFWLVFVPASHWFAFKLSPPPPLDVREIGVFAVLVVSTAGISFTFNGTTVFLTQWILIAVFLSYGLFMEMVLLQIAAVGAFIAYKFQNYRIHNYLVYSSMFSIISMAAGLSFFAAGGVTGDTLTRNLLPILIYLCVSFMSAFFLRQFILYMTGRGLRSVKNRLYWDTIIRLIVFPLGVGVYYLNELVGPIVFLIIGMPFISSILVLHLYNHSKYMNKHLQQAAAIGRQLTERLNVDEIFHLFLNKLTQTLPVDQAYILWLKDDELFVIRNTENGQGKSRSDISPIRKDQGISGHVLKTGLGAIYDKKSEWEQYSYGYSPEDAESIMCVPIMRSARPEGVLFLASAEQGAFKKYQLMIVDILSSYLAVALSNARHYEDTKRQSELCALTKIPNYRYFDRHLNQQMADLKSGKVEMLSLILIDIDHFKKINDTYGHQSGDEALIQLADLLTSYISGRGIVARYGGEEFVILLPDKNQQEARQIAEAIREKIANHLFLVTDRLGVSDEPTNLRMTASIGVATAPENAKDAVSLLRFADKALYIGAKRAGRNKVAQYMQNA